MSTTALPEGHPAVHDHKGKTCPVSGRRKGEFCPAQPGDSRSACPALNTMANHGYISRDGKNLSAMDLIKGLKACYGLSNPLAIFLSVVGFLMLKKFRRIDLFEIGKHGVIEHDSSLVHHDTPRGAEYAPIEIDEILVQKLIADAAPAPSAEEKEELLMDAKDVACARVRREAECRKPDAVHAEIARGEMAIILGVWEKKAKGKSGIPTEWLKTWIGEEKMPEGWRPDRKQGLLNTIGRSNSIRHAMNDMRKTKPSSESSPSSSVTNSIEKLPI